MFHDPKLARAMGCFPSGNSACSNEGDEPSLTLFMLGRLQQPGYRDTLCRIRNVSTGGMRIETLSPLALGAVVLIEPRSGVPYQGHVVWTRPGTGGIQLDQPVPREMLTAPAVGPFGKQLTQRAPRFTANAHAHLTVGGMSRQMRVVDLSLGGARLDLTHGCPVHERGRLAIAGLPSRSYILQWIRSGYAGISFLERLQFTDLAKWAEFSPLRYSADAAPA